MWQSLCLPQNILDTLQSEREREGGREEKGGGGGGGGGRGGKSR